MKKDVVTAAMIIIGDEILSGRTADSNLNFLAQNLTKMGISLREVRVIPDVENEIIDAVLAMHKKFDYVFTSGGIGPTHDDITVSSIAKAFGRIPKEKPDFSFKIENVFILAGVPRIFQKMFFSAQKELAGGKKIKSREIKVFLREEKIAKDFADLQKKYPQIAMGSYPFDGGTSLVFRGAEEDLLEKVIGEMTQILQHGTKAWGNKKRRQRASEGIF